VLDTSESRGLSCWDIASLLSSLGGPQVKPQRTDLPRKTYETPRLARYGRVEEVTRTGQGSGKEGGSFPNKKPVTFSNP